MPGWLKLALVWILAPALHAPLPHGAATDARPGSSDTLSSAPAHTCSPCATCCPGVALLNAPLTVMVPEAAVGVFAVLHTGLVRIPFDAPERPPRS